MGPRQKPVRPRSPSGRFLKESEMDNGDNNTGVATQASQPPPDNANLNGSEQPPSLAPASQEPQDPIGQLQQTEATATAAIDALQDIIAAAETEEEVQQQPQQDIELPIDPPRSRRRRSDNIRYMCMRCLNANTQRAITGEVQDEACEKAKRHHTRCTRCAGVSKACRHVSSPRLLLRTMLTCS